MAQKTIGIFSDTHAVLPALEVVLQEFEKRRVDEIIHLGDIISMGAYPKECMDILLNYPRLKNVRGNHDNDYVNNMTQKRGNSHVPVEHKEYTFSVLGEKYREKISKLPFLIEEEIYGKTFSFTHYARYFDSEENREKFYMIEPNPTPEKLDAMFCYLKGEVVFYGHAHSPSDITGKRRYIDVGSLACHRYNYVRAKLLTINDNGEYMIETLHMPYDREKALSELDKRNVPGKEEMKNYYFMGF